MAEDQKKKLPTAQKRMIQNEKRRLVNQAFKSRIRSAVRKFEEALQGADKVVMQENLNSVYSIVDKAVKRNIYKLNKAKRIKSRLTARMAKTA